MKILIVGKFTEGQFGYHIADSLRDMGHNTIEYDPNFKYKYSKTLVGRRLYQTKNLFYNNLANTRFFREARLKRINKILEENKVEFTILTYDFLFPDEVDLIKVKSKSPVVLWFPDSVANFNKAFFMIADYDALFFKDPFIVKVLRDQYNKLNVYYLPECCNPKYHKSITLNDDDRKEYGCDITTYGSPHNIRSYFFAQLLNNNYNIKIWGNQPPIWLNINKLKSLYTGVYVFNESKCKAVLAAKININTLHPTEVIGLNARTFETAGIGGFQIIHWRPGLAQLFDDGKELISFRNFDNLKTTISYFLDNEKERHDIAKRGQQRAYKEHTYQLRIQLMLDTVFNSKGGYELPDFKMTF